MSQFAAKLSTISRVSNTQSIHQSIHRQLHQSSIRSVVQSNESVGQALHRLNAATLPARILSFWFRDYKIGSSPSLACQQLWFQTTNKSINENLKKAIVQEFRKDLTDYLVEKNEGINGPYTAIENSSPESCLSLVILTQHIAPMMGFENTAVTSQLACSLSMLGISNAFDQQLDPVESVFFLTAPLLSEEPEITQIAHQKSLDLVNRISQSTHQSKHESINLGKPYLKFLRQFHMMATNHFQAVQKFGRLPHLNESLKRTPTRHEQKASKSTSHVDQSVSPTSTPSAKPAKPSIRKPSSSKPVKLEWPE